MSYAEWGQGKVLWLKVSLVEGRVGIGWKGGTEEKSGILFRSKS